MAERALNDSVNQTDVPIPRPRRLSLPLFMLSVLALTMFAAALRWLQLDRTSLWLDEGYTLLFSQLPFPRLITVGGAHEHPPLYYLIVHVALGLGAGGMTPRYVSLVAGTLSIPVIALLGARVINRPAGILAASLVAVSPFHVWYSYDGRAYALAGLLVLISYLCLFQGLDSDRLSAWCAYAICTAGCVYTEYTTVLVLVPQALFLVFRADRRRHVFISMTVAALLFVPWLGMLVSDATAVAGNYWIPPPTVHSVLQTTLEFTNLMTPCTSPPCSGQLGPIPYLSGIEDGVAVGLLLVVIALLPGIVITARHRGLVFLAWLATPFGVILLLALRRSLYLDRVFLDATFALFLVVALAAVGRSRILQASSIALAGLMLVGGLVTSLQPVSHAATPDWSTATHDFISAYRPGQSVVFYPAVVRELVQAYAPEGWRATREQPVWFTSYLDVPGWPKTYGSIGDFALRDLQLSSAASGQNAVWLLARGYTGLPFARRWFIQHGYHLIVSEVYAGNVRVELYDRRGTADLGPAVVQGFGTGWQRTGLVRVLGHRAILNGNAEYSRSFPVRAGSAYSVHLGLLALPPAGPSIAIDVYDGSGKLLGTFPRTQWYDLPVNGVWVTDPFGFIAPPDAVRATVRIVNWWGQTTWRDLAIYEEKAP